MAEYKFSSVNNFAGPGLEETLASLPKIGDKIRYVIDGKTYEATYEAPELIRIVSPAPDEPDTPIGHMHVKPGHEVPIGCLTKYTDTVDLNGKTYRHKSVTIKFAEPEPDTPIIVDQK